MWFEVTLTVTFVADSKEVKGLKWFVFGVEKLTAYKLNTRRVDCVRMGGRIELIIDAFTKSTLLRVLVMKIIYYEDKVV